MTCNACRRDNPSSVQFCLGCGHPISSPASAIAPQAMPVTPFAASEQALSLTGATARPFGLVFCAVVTFLTALAWLLGSGFLTLLTITESAANSNALSGGAMNTLQEQSGSLLLSPSFVSIGAPLLTLAGFVGITGSLGLWSRADWGRRVTAWLQTFGVVVGLIILSQAGTRVSQVAGLGGFFAFAGLIVIVYSAGIMAYLLRHETALWFQS